MPPIAQANRRIIMPRSICLLGLWAIAFLASCMCGRGEAMLQLYNVRWSDLSQKMPEIAEAGYDSLWLPPPTKGGSVYSVGYDVFDPFDLGDKNQRGTVATKYGTKDELIQAVAIAHRFGLRVYFDNIMNHRGNDVPGYNSSSPTNLYPGLVPGDFHLQTISGGYFRNWPSISDWNNVWQIQHQPLVGLVDLANESGSVNENFGNSLGSTIAKPYFIRQPTHPEYYMDSSLPAIAGSWRPFNGTNGVPVAEDVNSYLIRSAMWILNETKCDGFRFDAVKHVPSIFFGDTSATANGYVGAIQTMFDYVHGYGNNASGNGFTEGDDNRNSCFNTETTRNDAMLFGEHQGEPPSYSEYSDRGMRLLDSPLRDLMNNVLGNPSASLHGLDQRDSGGFDASTRVMYAQSHDNDYANRRELQNAFYFMREGLPVIYSDGYNNASGNPPFPRIPNAPYLGQFGDRKMPDIAYLHNQLARGGTRSRWSDNDIVAFERYDYREVSGNAFTNPTATVVLFVMNDNYAGTPDGEISFDDGVGQTTDGTYYECFPVKNSRNQGLVVGFPPGSVLSQLADSPNKSRACNKLLVREATQSLTEANSTKDDPDPSKRKVYVGSQTLAPGGGAIEFKIPSGSYVLYGYQWPEPSRANSADAITFRQGNTVAPRITVYRHDGVNGDSGFNPQYPFKMRGSIDANGNVMGGVNVSNKTYAIDIPVVTNGLLDILVRCDASASNVLAKLDGGMDLNSQLGIGLTTGLERRDFRPGASSGTDPFLGYEQMLFDSRYGPEKFGAVDTNRNNTVSLGAETYLYIVGGTNTVINGSGYDSSITNSTATWVYHSPSATNNAISPNNTPTQRVPLNPTAGNPVDIYVRVGFQSQINTCYIYYTIDGSNPEGAYGVGKGTTQVVAGHFLGDDSTLNTIDWWKGTIPSQSNGTQVRYKIALFKNNITTISDKEDAKEFGLTTYNVTNFDPTAVSVWLHNDRNTNSTITGLQEGYHILRARAFLPRPGKSSVYNTFLQTFYYDAQTPNGVIAFPASNGTTLGGSSYNVVVRADSSTTGVEFNISDNDSNNDDAATGLANGNGSTNGVPVFVAATPVTPNAGISQVYTNLPLEYRFNYYSVPTNGPATITVHLKKITSNLYPNRFTTLTRTVNAAGPAQTLLVSSPSVDNQLIVITNNTDTFPLRACFTQTLTTNNIDLFSIYINGVLQPRRDPGTQAPQYFIGGSYCDPGLRALSYNWSGFNYGTNTIQVNFVGNVSLSATRTAVVLNVNQDTDGDGVPDYQEILAGTDPNDPQSLLRITSLDDAYRSVVWDSIPGKNYQVLSTTDLNVPMTPLSPVIQAEGTTSLYFDESGGTTNKFYRIQLLP